MTDPKYKAYGLHNFRQIPQVSAFPGEEEKFAIEVVGNVLPFKVNNYVTDELIDWTKVPHDPIYTLTFPQRGMLRPEHFHRMAETLRSKAGKSEVRKIANEIRMQLNPNPDGQMEHNVPTLDGVRLSGIQHKYDQTMLFFPEHGQTCHAYCTFCFRWPQFVGIEELKFAERHAEAMLHYLRQHPEITDVLFTGGDPMTMKVERLRKYIDPILENRGKHSVQTIRIGTKALSYWPYRFTRDKDSEELLRLFRKVNDAGIHLSIMAHFNHPVELQTPAVREAILNIQSTGTQIRSQSPLMKNINDSPDVWIDMWKEQTRLGIIPYYMFLARETGASDYFAVPLARSWRIFQEAYRQVSGISRTVRGPSMSTDPGKIQILGVTDIHGEKVFVLNFIQGRIADWVHRPFFAKYDPKAVWLNDLEPAFGEKQFFFEQEWSALEAEPTTILEQS